MKKKSPLLSRLLRLRKQPGKKGDAMKTGKKTGKTQKIQATRKSEKKEKKEKIIPKAVPKKAPAPRSSTRTLDNPELEDELNLIGAAPIDVGGRKLSFPQRTIEGERETVVNVNDTVLRVQIAGRNAGEMLATVAADKGELRLRGRLFGLTDIEAWMTQQELARMCAELQHCTAPTTLQSTYTSRPPSTHDRTPRTVDVRFLPLR